MIKESVQHTIQLIETIKKVDPTAYQDQKLVLDGLVLHMRLVIDSLERHQKVS